VEKVLTTSHLIRAFLILAIFTTSFDIFLVFRLGFTFRAAQILLVIPIGYALLQLCRNPVAKWPLGFTPLLLWAFFLAIFIPNTDFPLRSIGYWLWLAFNTLMIFVVVQLIDDYRKVLTIVRWYLYSFLFVASFGIFQFFAPRLGLGAPLIVEWWYEGSLPRVNGFSYEPSYFAAYLIMGWVLTLYLLEHRSTIINRKILGLIAMVTTLALVLSSSRAGLLAMAIWLAQYPALLIWRLLRGFLNTRLLTISATLVLVLLLTTVGIAQVGSSNLEFLLAGIGLLGQTAHSLVYRTQTIQDTLEIFLRSPFIGYSLGGISSAIGHLQGVDVSSLEAAKKSEGMAIFAEALAASGIIGVIPFAIYILKIIRDPLRLAGKSSDPNLRAILAGVTYALVIELIILQFNQNILRLYLWMHIAILSAVYSVGTRNSPAMAETARIAEPDQPAPPEDPAPETCLV
jgi:hypothetical protein